MEDAEAKDIAEAVDLEKRAIDLDGDLMLMTYSFNKASAAILFEISRIRQRQNELSGKGKTAC